MKSISVCVSTFAAIVLGAASVALPSSAVAVAGSLSSMSAITVHLTYAGSFTHTATIGAREHWDASAPQGCFVFHRGSVTTYMVEATTPNDRFQVQIAGYRSSRTTYGAVTPGSGSSPTRAGAVIQLEVLSRGHDHYYRSSDGKPTVKVRVAGNGKAGTVHLSHTIGRNESIAGSWSCSRTETVPATHR